MARDGIHEADLLIDEIRAETRATRSYTGRGRLDERVIAALRAVPREAFVPANLRHRAYGNHPLPIGHAQTISQPYIVALMTDLIRPGADDVVLEIGTGSGYQTAILSRLVRQVYSLEIVAELAREAEERLQRLRCTNVEVRCGNGRQGWAGHAPYDAILVAAAADAIPPALIDQLKPGGRLVIPVGNRHEAQELLLLTRRGNGEIDQRRILPVVFVPLTGTEHGQPLANEENR